MPRFSFKRRSASCAAPTAADVVLAPWRGRNIACNQILSIFSGLGLVPGLPRVLVICWVFRLPPAAQHILKTDCAGVRQFRLAKSAALEPAANVPPGADAPTLQRRASTDVEPVPSDLTAIATLPAFSDFVNFVHKAETSGPGKVRDGVSGGLT